MTKMLPIALIYTPDFAIHDPGQIRVEGNNLYHRVAGQDLLDPVYTLDQIQFPYPVVSPVPHPESSSRLTAAMAALRDFGLSQQMTLLEPESATEEDLQAVHTSEYIAQVRAISAAGGYLAESTYVSPGSYKTALISAGAGISALKGILSGQIQSALCLNRPPGHHAGRKQAGGFCLFNNAAIAAKYCLKKEGVERVLILDWDLHHGDGTQDIVQDDPRIIFCSLHQFGKELYPQTGNLEDIGAQGNIINLPLPAKLADDQYWALFQTIIPALIAQAKPDIVIVSAGFDGHLDDINHLYLYDPGAGLCLSAQLYYNLTRLVAEAIASVGGHYLLLLEGGYDATNLGNCLVNTSAAMLGLPLVIEETLPQRETESSFNLEEYIATLNALQLGRWQFSR
ncbi:histone deacetylase [Coleofasciculus sp. FACHB-SPT36]|uniref:histone deacetylase family protein n=1 Tax=Cyanophyceae TaxID=3028117 RepID=UPI00168AE42B|nr:histone deacetylase [Coleofasciculus sp. FACHB-SPT36]MBD2538429.1 histone deacetylase [Coleofasciculus sp. FACHB-SPT36]